MGFIVKGFSVICSFAMSFTESFCILLEPGKNFVGRAEAQRDRKSQRAIAQSANVFFDGNDELKRAVYEVSWLYVEREPWEKAPANWSEQRFRNPLNNPYGLQLKRE